MLFGPYVRVHNFGSVRVSKWPPAGKILLTRLAICFLGISA